MLHTRDFIGGWRTNRSICGKGKAAIGIPNQSVCVRTVVVQHLSVVFLSLLAFYVSNIFLFYRRNGQFNDAPMTADNGHRFPHPEPPTRPWYCISSSARTSVFKIVIPVSVEGKGKVRPRTGYEGPERD
jgi:hypothetical protein